ncbi:hypothetical protein QT327_16810 [Olivibacter sp. 47]|jgi:hypothetical protein|uniref:hypothetical protein n=1 Tax=Olivibacter sp. 47 TaxID=3056486 RepID=UPI0025A3C37D|nr:hypothetical protein [Olivibacter sp. 47]MDM8175989.1 hypothetical protein [Olivibacter sp. 47]
MQEILKERLYSYLVDNRVDLFLDLQHKGGLKEYLNSSVSAIAPQIREMQESGEPDLYIEEYCMDELTRKLRPSPFLYLYRVLEEEFEKDFYRMREDGILTYELINILGCCRDIFDRNAFSEETEEDRYLRYEITGAVGDYLSGS